jgi:ABC-type polysaccharide/polyol phosphate export permease
MAFGQVEEIPSRYPVFMREVQNHMYTPTAYYLSVTIGSFVLLWFYPVALSVMCFYFFGFANHAFVDLLWFTSILYLMAMTGSQTGIAFGSIFNTHDDGFRLMQILCIAFFMSAGVFVNTSKR